jgi:hypothetical protein
MKNSTDDLIRGLTLGLKPVKPAGSPYFMASIFVLMGLMLMGMFFLAASLRIDLREYLGKPQSILDLSVSFLLAVSAGGVAIFLARPGRESQVRILEVFTVAFLGLGLFNYSFRIFDLSIEQKALGLSISGVECFLTVLTYAATLGIFLMLWLRKGASVNPSLSGLMIGTACLALGNITISCCCGLDNGVHIFLWHLALPLLTVLALGFVAGRVLLKW